MHVITGSLGSGKTTELIKLASIHNATIVTPYNADIKEIICLASKMKVKIKKPISMQTYCDREYHMGKEGEVFVFDEVDRCLSYLSQHRGIIAAVSANASHLRLPHGH